MGVMIGEDMLIPCIFFFRGDFRADRMDEARDCGFSSWSRTKLDGLCFSFLARVDVEVFETGVLL